MTNPKRLVYKLSLLLVLVYAFAGSAKAQTETIKTGSFIINMGNTNTASINDDVKPFGLIYNLMHYYQVPVKWVINQSKLKDGADFALIFAFRVKFKQKIQTNEKFC